MADKTLGSLRQILTHLCSLQDKTWVVPSHGSAVDEHVHETYRRLLVSWRPAKTDDIDRIIGSVEKDRQNVVALDNKTALYLCPPDDDQSIIPLLTFEVSGKPEAGKPSVQLELRMLLVHCHQDKCRPPHGIVIRYDRPDGAHTYHHVQLCFGLTGPRRYTSRLLSFPEWLPENVPVIPIKAKSPISLLMCLLTGLYGNDGEAVKMMEKIPDVGSALDAICQPG